VPGKGQIKDGIKAKSVPEQGQIKGLDESQICTWKGGNKKLDKRAKSVLGNVQIKD
jgi:hypothetical protein